jgi:hypothetical protein
VPAAAYHLYLERHPRKAIVVVDASAAMAPVWSQVQPLLDGLSGTRYTQFTLATERDLVHSWSPHLNLGQLVPVAPRDFSRLHGPDSHLAMADAPQRILITNASPAETAAFTNWRIIRLSQ